MKHNAIEYLKELNNKYFEIIRNNNKTYFVRKRKIDIKDIFLQMFSNRGLTQKNEILTFSNQIKLKQEISAIGFYKARMKINPDSIHTMMKDYISDIYLYEKESLKKLKGYYITAVDGSDIVLPSSKENELIYGRNADAKTNIQPVAGKVSMIYDCLNKLILDTRIDKFRHNEIELAELHLKATNEV